MPGTLTPAAPLTLFLAMSNAFMLRAPKATTADSAGNKQVSVIAPLRVDGRRLSNGGALSRFGDNGDMEDGQRLPRAPSAGCYRGWGSQATCPLHMTKGVQDGNTTIPIGGVVGGSEGEDSGLALPRLQDGGVEMSSTIQGGNDDRTHDHNWGALDDADIASDTDFVTDTDIYSLNQTKTSHEGSSDAVNDESHGMTSGDTAVIKEELPFEVAADGTVEETSLGTFGPVLLDDKADDVVGSVVDNSEDYALDEDWLINLPEDGIIDDIVLERIINISVEDTVDGDMTPMFNDALSEPATSETVSFDDPLNDLIRTILNDAFAGAAASDAVILDDDMFHLVGTVLVEDVARGGAYEALVLDDDMDDLMWSKLYHALYGRKASAPRNVKEFLDGLMASVLHNAFFGPAASKVVSSLTNNSGVSGLVVEDYIQKVSGLYDKFEEARFPNIAATTAVDEELPLEGTTDAVDGIDHSTAFYEVLPFIITDERVGGGIRLGAFGPVIPVYAVDIETQPTPHDTLSDKAASKTVIFDNAVRDLVLSLANDAINGGASSDLTLDDGVENLMWAKLHHATSVTGRAPSGDRGLGDSLDVMLTNLLHKAFFGSVASRVIASFTKYTDDRELVVEDYVRAVSKVYDKFKEARGRSPSPDNGAPVVRKAKKGGWRWLKKLWGRGRRKGG